MSIPTRWIRVVPQKKTVATRGEGGRFTGRAPSKKGGDNTKSLYLLHDTDLDGNGKFSPSERGGTIHGRTDLFGRHNGKAVQVLASNRAKGYQKRV
jgi:hypothetical protein